MFSFRGHQGTPLRGRLVVAAGLGLAAAVLVACPAQAVPSSTVAFTDDFEVTPDAPVWSYENIELRYVPAECPAGAAQQLKIYPDPPAYSVGNSTQSPPATVAAGDQVTLDALYVGSYGPGDGWFVNAHALTASLVFFDAAGAALGETFSPRQTEGTAVCAPVQLVGTAPAGAVSARARLWSGASAAIPSWWDNVSLTVVTDVPAPTPTPTPSPTEPPAGGGGTPPANGSTVALDPAQYGTLLAGLGILAFAAGVVVVQRV
jgi:hypothetical protein